MDEDKSKSIIIDEIYMEEREWECIHKIIKKEKYANNEAEHEEPTVTNDPVVKQEEYFDIFKCGENILNKHDAMCKQACMTTPREKYYT